MVLRSEGNLRAARREGVLGREVAAVVVGGWWWVSEGVVVVALSWESSSSSSLSSGWYVASGSAARGLRGRRDRDAGSSGSIESGGCSICRRFEEPNGSPS